MLRNLKVMLVKWSVLPKSKWIKHHDDDHPRDSLQLGAFADGFHDEPAGKISALWSFQK